MSTSLFQATINNLKSLNHTPTKKFGQNFLIDKNIVEKFVRSSELSANDIVVEIGPGLGTVSEEILSYNVNLHAIELDGRLFHFLQTKYDKHPNFHIMSADAVLYPIADLDTECSSYKVVASLPYAISSAWFDAILSLKHLPSTISVIIQLDAANRFLAKHNTKLFCPLSIFLQSAFTKAAMFKISKNSFYPIPKVDSVILFLKRKPDIFIFSEQAKTIIRTLFNTRRKQISTIVKEQNLNIDQWLERNNIPPHFRPEQIDLLTWQKLEKRY